MIAYYPKTGQHEQIYGKKICASAVFLTDCGF
jgi:hypothetical protein